MIDNINEDIFHPASEFHLLPWDKLDPKGYGISWTSGTRGMGLSRNAIMIMIFRDAMHVSLAQDYWEVPCALQALIETHERMAKEQLRIDFRRLLDVAKSD